MRSLLVLLPLALLGGCAGYAADYWKPKDSLIAPQLARYGLDPTQAQCVGGRLKANLTVWQMRQLADLAGRLVAGGQNPASLTTREFRDVAGLVKDPKVGAETAAALEACNASATSVAPAPSATTASPEAPAPGATAPPEAPASAPAPRALPLWVNLGTAATGQSISVDAATLENAPGWRQGWFRLANPGEAGPGALSYRLKVDCVDKAITATGGRKYGPAGAILEEREYAKPEGPLAIEAGTVMEIAYRALCT